MQDLVKRYIMKRQRGSQTEGVTEDDINEIKQDINAFRYELLEVLQNNGMKIPSQGQAKRHSECEAKNCVFYCSVGAEFYQRVHGHAQT